MNNSLIILQARLSSTRLPEKVLLPFWKGLCLLDLQLEQLKQFETPVVLATTTNSADDGLEQWANQHQLPCFRGEEDNVLKRFIDCAGQFNAQRLIRVCSDNPFIQFDQIPHYLEVMSKGIDYISYCDHIGTPAIRTHWGLYAEGVRLEALEKAAELILEETNFSFYQEHVTNFIYAHSNEFTIELIPAPEMIIARDDLRFTIDTADDFVNMQQLMSVMPDHMVSLPELISKVDELPDVKRKMQQGIQMFEK